MTSRTSARILVLGKAGDELCARASAYLDVHAEPVTIHLGHRGEAFPTLRPDVTWEYLISYLSPWIVPEALLRRVQRASINFHPGPPEYPGIGCTNFALYEDATVYGVTCHHMATRVDTGPIISVRRFPVHPSETVLSLTQRCYAAIAELFYEMADLILAGGPLPVSSERWTRRPFRRDELNALCRLTPDMSQEEIRRRVRATTFPGARAASFAEQAVS